MKLTDQHVRQLEQFMSKLQGETYPEPAGQIHHDVTHRMFEQVKAAAKLSPGAKVLDVGCGNGLAMELFAKDGFAPIGITVNDEDLEVCRAKGLEVRKMDQSFPEFDDETFDLVWCRHCLEHSFMPYFTLWQLSRLVKPGGWLYVEVPAPDTSAHHETNVNHYSVLPKRAWINLIQRSGFSELHLMDINLKLDTLGDDQYWSFFAVRNTQ